LLTTLTVLLVLMMFVFAPLQAIGIKLFQVLGFVSALAVIGGVFLTSGSPTVVVALLAAFIMAGTAAVSRLNSPSAADVYLLSGAFLIMGTVLIGVVARAVFSPGRVTHHRIIGAILVYLSVALTFVALYSIVGLLVPNAFSGMSFEDNSALASKVHSRLNGCDVESIPQNLEKRVKPSTGSRTVRRRFSTAFGSA
jgi:hypothetical protein